MLSKETLNCFSPLQISHQKACHPHSQYHSQSTHWVQSQGRGEKAEGRKDKMRRKKGEVNKGKNVTVACPGGSEQ